MCQADLHPNKHTENDPVTRSLKHFPSMTVVYKIPDDIIRLWWNTADCFVCRFLTDGRRPIRSFSPKHASPSVSRSGSDWLERLLSHLRISSASGETAESHTHTHTHTHARRSGFTTLKTLCVVVATNSSSDSFSSKPQKQNRQLKMTIVFSVVSVIYCQNSKNCFIINSSACCKDILILMFHKCLKNQSFL